MVLEVPHPPALSRRRLWQATISSAAVGFLGNGVARAVPGAARGRRIKVKLKTDGTDQSRVLQRAIDAAPHGAHLRLPAGRFRIDRRINIRGKHGLTISGPVRPKKFIGYTTLDGFHVGDVSKDGRYSYRSHWAVTGSRDVILRRVNAVGPNKRRQGGFSVYKQDVEFEHAFQVSASRNVLLDDCGFRNVNGDGVYIGSTGAPCRDITVRGLRGRFCGRQQLGITNVDGLLVEDVTISGGGRSGVDIEPNAKSQYVRNVVLRRLDMRSRFYPYVIGGITDKVRRENITLESCTARRSSSSHPAVQATRNGTNLRVVGHRDLRQGSRYGFSVADWAGVSIEGCHISSGQHTPVSYGVRLDSCSGTLKIIGNTFHVDQIGFDQLFAVSGTTLGLLVQHYGNVWGNGSQTND